MSDQIEQVMDKVVRRLGLITNTIVEPQIRAQLEPIARLLRAGATYRDSSLDLDAVDEAWDAALRAALEER